MNTIPFTLTRYLYIKEDVMMSLIISVFEKDYDRALFWASELYYSGYTQETALFIVSLYDNFYRPYNPKLLSLVYTLKTTDSFEKIPTILKNLTSRPRKYSLQYFMQRNPYPDIEPDAHKKETSLHICAPKEDEIKYGLHNMKEKTYNILKKVCKYGTTSKWGQVFECGYINKTNNEITKLQLERWLYYASFSPLWKERIEEYNGSIDHEKECVHFEDEPFEMFHNNYDYELDEQSKEILEKLTHINRNYYTINDFYKKFEPNLKIHIVKKSKLNK